MGRFLNGALRGVGAARARRLQPSGPWMGVGLGLRALLVRGFVAARRSSPWERLGGCRDVNQRTPRVAHRAAARLPQPPLSRLVHD